VPTSSKPFAFISYAPADNSHGFVDTLADVLAMELRARTGQPVDLYHDKQTPLEQSDERERALNEATFLIPILSPSYLQSEVGRRDLQQFLTRADEQRSSLIFPVYYIDTPQLGSRTSSQPRDTLSETVGKRQWIDWRELRFAYWNSPNVLRAVSQLAEVMLSAAKLRQPAPTSAREFWEIDKLRLSNFRCFDELELDFRRKSSLDGEWTCLAGINGSGKSSILQALCIAMLGERAGDLGGGLLGRMRRVGTPESVRTEIELTLSRGSESLKWSVQIDGEGFLRTNSPNMAENNVVVGYGATRNLGAEQDSPFKNMSRAAQRMIGLFYPLSQLARAEMLLSDRRRGQGLVSLFARLVNDIFDRDVTVALSTSKYFSQADEIAEGDPNPLRFEVMGKDRVGAMDLPDGFRSSAAWLADLCAAWFEQQPDPTAEVDPKSIEAIVLIDEIDLHLHPTLQRALVPRLRKALPKVQWVVTTHSPLVLANFDANEIIALDRNEEGHIRPLDRQIMGFSTDQIYEWLMGTRPTGVAIEEITMRADQGKADRDRLAALLRTSPDVDEEKARKQVSDFNELLRSFKH